MKSVLLPTQDHRISFQIENILIRLYTIPPTIMGSSINEKQEMAVLLAKRDARIRELEIENMELKSKLDKYQMIFSGNL